MTQCERLLAVLSDGKPHSHHELYALGMIVHSRVADLRRQGHTIEQWSDTGLVGDRIYFYRLVGSSGEQTGSRATGSVCSPGDPSPLLLPGAPDGSPFSPSGTGEQPAEQPTPKAVWQDGTDDRSEDGEAASPVSDGQLTLEDAA